MFCTVRLILQSIHSWLWGQGAAGTWIWDWISWLCLAGLSVHGHCTVALQFRPGVAQWQQLGGEERKEQSCALGSCVRSEAEECAEIKS